MTNTGDGLHGFKCSVFRRCLLNRIVLLPDMTANCRFRVGDTVRIVVLHDRLMTAGPEAQAIYKNALMRPLRIDGIDSKDGQVWVELNVNDDGSQADSYGEHTLCLPLKEIELVSGQDLESNGSAD